MDYVKKNLHGLYQDALVVNFELLQVYKRIFFHFLLNTKKKEPSKKLKIIKI